MLRQGELDCAILADPFPSAGLDFVDLYEEPFLVAIPKGHEWSDRKTIGQKELKEQKSLFRKVSGLVVGWIDDFVGDPGNVWKFLLGWWDCTENMKY